MKVRPVRFYVTRADRRADRSCEERVRRRRRRPVWRPLAADATNVN
ncbi:hypothetical protein BURMUCF2_B0536 [Burkholderia multivorans CF2]|nr:hypothetical protein BURMUCF2_B0536 [Burkholderia multivorans CF2]